MDKYIITGMSCAACQVRVEKAVSKVDGVKTCNVSLLTNTLSVEGDAKAEDIISAVENAGYGANVLGQNKADKERQNIQRDIQKSDLEEVLIDRETPILKRRLIFSIVFLCALMYFSMGVNMFSFPLPDWLNGNYIALGLLQLLLSAIVMIINQKFFVSGFKGLIHGAPNMDTLIALGSGAAFAYSTVMLFAMTDVALNKGFRYAGKYMHEFYFESAAMILTLITVGKMLESYSKGKTTNALKSLISLSPKTATVIRNGKEEIIIADDVKVGDIFVVKPGEAIPVDGVVLEGSSAVDESALTGESLPVDKSNGSKVSAATINSSGFLKCEATRVGDDTTLAKIIKTVSDLSATKAPIAKLADKISGVFVPVVIVIAVITTFAWLYLGQTYGFALARGICVLVVSCPCALGLATPVAIMVGNGVGARNGILFKTAEALSECGKIQCIALDKTGTITKGEPEVTTVYAFDDVKKEELLYVAKSLERLSEHPLAKAVVKHKYDGDNEVSGLEGNSDHDNCNFSIVKDFEILPGNGLKGIINGKAVFGGNYAFIKSKCDINDEHKRVIDDLSLRGETPLIFAEEGRVLGVISVSDKIKEDSKEAIFILKKLGLKVFMITGDNEKTANVIGKEVSVDGVYAGVLPEGKEKIIRNLNTFEKTAMVGDGINDAIALTGADIGIAIGAGTDVAIDAADVVLMNNSLMDVVNAIRLSRKTYKNIKENLFWALFYNTLLIPAAAGVYVKAFGITMNPMLGALAMSLSSFCVVSNALRLNLFKVKKGISGETDSQIENQSFEKEKINDIGTDEREDLGKEEKMKKTINIKGMMCGHCEATVKKALEAIDGVESADVSHENDKAVVTLSKEIDDDYLRKAVEDKDYQVISII